MTIAISSDQQMKEFGAHIGALVRGGEIFELVGDVGAGKTTFTKGLARGMEVTEDVQSPTFTISRTYTGRDALQLTHYDFYRLPDAGIMADEVGEVVRDPRAVVVIEWSEVVVNVLPEDRIRMTMRATAEDSREVRLEAGGPVSLAFIEALL